MAQLEISELTGASVDGAGVFDVLMRATRAHLDAQFKDGRIKGPEYATVYLGSLQLAMQTGLSFLLEQRKNDLEAQLLEKQIDKVNAEITQTEAQTQLVAQQRLNLIDEGENIPLQGAVLVAQECLLRAQFDNTEKQTTKVQSEIDLLAQKTVTERAQTQSIGVDDDSVIGKQKGLYQAQRDGFTRDAEQKAAKILVDTWNVRRTTDEATSANSTNKLDDATVGRAIEKLMTGVGA